MMLLGKTIGVDPGHGGADPGAVDRIDLAKNDKLYTEEADLNLRASLKLAEALRAKGAKVVLTRNTDKTLTLRQRSDLLNKAKVQYVVSVHCNAGPATAWGAEIFIQGKGGAAENLAAHINCELLRQQVHTRGVKVKNLHMTRETNAPAILIELDFITNVVMESKLHTERYLDKLVACIVHGFEKA